VGSNIVFRTYTVIDFENVLKKRKIAGTINAPDTAYKTVIAYQRDTGVLLGATVWDPDTGNYEIYVAEQSDENIMLIARDEGGNFNADIYDRLTQAVHTFIADDVDNSFNMNNTISEDLLFKTFSISQQDHFIKYPFSIVSSDVKGIISDYMPTVEIISGVFRDESEVDLTVMPENVQEGSVVNEDIVIESIDKNNKVHLGRRAQKEFDIIPDFFDDSSCIFAASMLNGTAYDVVNDVEIQAALTDSEIDGLYGPIKTSPHTKGYIDTGVNFDGTSDFSVSFWEKKYAHNHYL
jgi:hypothetical protein